MHFERQLIFFTKRDGQSTKCMSECLDETTIRRSTLGRINGRSNGKREMTNVAFYRKAFRQAVFKKVNWKSIFQSLKRPFWLRRPWRHRLNGQKESTRVENGGGILPGQFLHSFAPPSANLLGVYGFGADAGCGWCVRVCQMSFSYIIPYYTMTSFDQSADVTAYMTSYHPAWFMWILSRGSLGSICALVRED